MKKSRIIVPAMAVIAFSTAASIAGSVAWFTATRQATISAGSYAVVKTTSDMKIALADGCGTTTSGSTVDFTGLLTDGSFNHDTTVLKVFTPASDGKSIERETEISGKTKAQLEAEGALLRGTVGTKNVYTAATFDISFTMNFGSGAKDIGLFLNNTAGQTAFTSTTTPLATAKGFRMAFVPKTIPSGSAGVSKVLADLREDVPTGTTEHTIRYVQSTSGDNYMDGVAYNGDLMDSTYNDDLPTSSTARATAIARPDYIGMFKAPTQPGNVTLVFTVVAWFEGTDAEIKNRDLAAEYQTVEAKLVFDAVDLAAAS